MLRSIAAVVAAAAILLLHADFVHPTGRVFPPFVDHIDDHHHDNVPREKAKVPKFKERYKFPQVTHIVYFDVGECSDHGVIIYVYSSHNFFENIFNCVCTISE